MRSFFISFIFLISLLSFSSSFAGIKYAAPNGNDTNTGNSPENPISLNYAFSLGSPLNPGDSLILLDGRYDGNFIFEKSGTIEKPIYILPQNSGEAKINPGINRTNGSAITVNGSNVWLIGIHISSTTEEKREDLGNSVVYETGISVFGTNVKLINCWIYDVSGGGLELWSPALDLEVYGCVIFNNGNQSPYRGTGHGLYVQHNQVSNPKILQNNIVFQNASQGFNLYTTNPENAGIISFENTSFNTGAIANFNEFLFRPPHNFTIGSQNNLSHQMKVYDNVFYSDLQGGRLSSEKVSNVTIGRNYQPNNKIEFYNNFLMGGRNVVEFQPLENLRFSGNILYNNHGKFLQFLTLPTSMTGTYWDENSYFQSSNDPQPFTGSNFAQWKLSSGFDQTSTLALSIPQDPKVFIRKNKYEEGKYYVTIVNPGKTSSVKVDFSQFGIENGTAFQIIDFQNPFFSEYKINGNYNGQPLELPMNHKLSLAPKGNMPHDPVHTDESFGVFQVVFKANSEKPVFKNQIEVELNGEGIGKTTLKDYLENVPASNWTSEFSIGPDYYCDNLGINEVLVKILDGSGNVWSQVVKVLVKDKISPVLIAESKVLEFDKSKGILEVNPEIFITNLDDNCGIATVSLSKTRFECGDLELIQEIKITVKDNSGNETIRSISVEFSTIESQKVSLQANKPLYSGGTVELSLGEELDYEVISWYRNGSIMDGIKGKTIVVNQAGNYFATLRLASGCIVESNKLEISVTDVPFAPVKDLIELNLDENGEASLEISDLFTSWPPSQDLEITTSDLNFDCESLGEHTLEIRIESQSGQIWEETTTVLVKDNSKPVIVSKNVSLNFDPSIGAIELTPEMFVESVTDNCGIKSLTISKQEVGCGDFASETPIEIRAEDNSGNVTESTATLNLTWVDSKPVFIEGVTELCEGNSTELTLSSEAEFEVVRWRRNGVEIAEQSGKNITIEEGGAYHAVIRYSGGCLAETGVFEVQLIDIPQGEIKVDGNILIAPEGMYTYQWYKGDQAISGAANQTFEVNQMGSFSVSITNEFGCSTHLKAVEMTISGFPGGKQIEAEALVIYPNPSKAEVVFEPKGDLEFAENSWKVYDLNGKDVGQSVFMIHQSSKQIRLDVSTLASGTYSVMVESHDHRIFLGRFVRLD
ncbi:T9SS type A sorting domain-containing protein [Algoriphagus sp. PAP.12]|uniref:T9SS type A sorting domain-containing protein n=1 Tax=Algoriphagus sp. PAP.12 TaxID=2996678 RepID=UPI00227D490B|nr:T9SS type A sorting domain-containing protein [Algoriphagus sp. PAP.12]